MAQTDNKEELTVWQKVVYHSLFGIWYVLSILPMWIHYAFSSIVALLLFYVIRYRRNLVHRNMRDAFPEMSEKQLYKEEYKFYQHFCDIFIESLKYISISDKELMARMKMMNMDRVKESYRSGRCVALYLGHYANWEWISSLPLWADIKEVQCLQLYHPLENKVFDKIVGYTRERFGGRNIPVNESIRHLVKYKKADKPFMLGFIADQVPFWNNIHYWTNFLNHPDTPVFTGPEKLMKKFNMDVYYLDVKKVRRGYYEVEFKLITDDPNSYKDYELTEIYTRMLDETICNAPAYWLWTHNRWKRTKAEWDKMYDPETGKVFMR